MKFLFTQKKGMANTMCNLILDSATEKAYREYHLDWKEVYRKARLEGCPEEYIKGYLEGYIEGYVKGRQDEARRFGTLVQILLKEEDIEMVQKVTDDPALRESLYKKYHIE